MAHASLVRLTSTVALITATLGACSSAPQTTVDVPAPSENASTHETSSDYAWSEADVVDLGLGTEAITVGPNAGSKVTVSGSTVTIRNGGTYRLRGDLDDGALIVSSADEEVVRLILDGATIRSTSGNAPLAVLSAAKAVIILAEGSTNLLADDDTYTLPSGSDEPNATLFSAANLSIYGEGAGSGVLVVESHYNDGIHSKDGLVIRNARIDVTATADDGIRGKDYLQLVDTSLTIDAAGDGMKSDNEEDATLGFIECAGSTISIVSGGDAINAQTNLVIIDGTFDLDSGGGAGATLASDASAKALKGLASVAVFGGSFTIDAADDAVHSNSLVAIEGGTFAIESGDDAVHADVAVVIRGGELVVSRCFEGLEATGITVEAGRVEITSSDDGVNAASDTGSPLFAMSGGALLVNASGDGLDANGSIVMTGGLVIVDGPTANDNGALDYDGVFEISGGHLLAVGSSGMAQAPSTSSSQRSLHLRSGAAMMGGRPGGGASSGRTLSAGTTLHLESDDGTTLATYTPKKAYQSVVLSGPELGDALNVTFFSGGTSTVETDEFWTDTGYSAGTEVTSFTLSGAVTTASF